MAVISARLTLVALLALAACGDDATPPPALPESFENAATQSPLTPRAQLFGPPTHIRARLSPDGAMVSWLAPLDGALNIWVAPADAPEEARPVTSVGAPGISSYIWARDDAHVLYVDPYSDPERMHVISLNVATGTLANLTPEGTATRARIVATSWDFPTKVIIAADALEPGRLDLYEVNILSGDARLLFENTAGFTKFHFDPGLRLQAAERPTAQGARELFALDRGGWRRVTVFAPEDAAQSHLLAVDRGGRTATAVDSTGRDSAALVRIDLTTGERSVIGAVNGADVGEVLFHPVTAQPEAFSVERLSLEWLPLSGDIAAAFETIDDVVGGHVRILSRTLDDRQWILFTWAADNPGTYYIFDREALTVSHFVDIRPELADRPARARTPVVLRSRDGVELTAYLSLPPGADEDGDGRPDTPAPMVLMPIEYPGDRWSEGYDDRADWLSERGYAVLALNSRGASGAGKTFLNAAEGEWGGAVQDDVRDAAQWAIERGVADAERIAVFGAGFGGVTALRAAARDADLFVCAAAIDPPLDLVAVIEDIPPYFSDRSRLLRRVFGDPADAADRARLTALSPTSFAPEISRPILIADEGLNDPDAVSRARAFVESMPGEATLAMFPSENGGLDGPGTRIALAAAAEAFFGDCLGGAVEPVQRDIAGSPLSILYGAEYVTGLAESAAALATAER